MRRLQNVQVPQMKPPNPAQASAINSALTNPYTLIQGPPGTGKTVTGVRLAYLLIQANRSASHEENKDNVRPQLMYCGPSNKSVDVVAGRKKRDCHDSRASTHWPLGHEVKILKSMNLKLII